MLDDDFTIDLDDAAVKELETAYGIQTPSPTEKVEHKAEKQERQVTKEDRAPAKTDENDLLRRVREAEERAATERAARIQAEKLAHERSTTIAVTSARAAESDVHAVANALTKATSEAEALKRANQAALEAGDYAAASDATEKLAEIKAKIIQLQDGKAALEDRLRTARDKAETATKMPAPQDEPTDPMDKFFAATGLPPRAQAWFRAHPEAAPHNDRAMYYKALSAHETVVKSGVQDGSPEYFDKLDEIMGYRQPKAETEDVTKVADKDEDPDVEVDDKPTRTVAPKRVAAPVARDSVLHRRADGKFQIKLTAEQAKMADELGISRANYAKNLLKAEQEGKLGGHTLG